MIATFSLSPVVTMPSMTRSGGSVQKGRSRTNLRTIIYFVMTLLSLTITLACQRKELRSNFWTITSLFLGTAPVAASLATRTALSVKYPRAGSPTMVSMTAGSSRTLIELAKPENDESGKFQIEAIYIDEDDEDALMVLRRANVETKLDDMGRFSKSGRVILQRAVWMLKNPIVAIVLTGNIASTVGILPPGITGFLPAVSILIVSKMKRVLPVLRRLRSFFLRKTPIRTPAIRTIFSKVKLKLNKIVSRLYENRSKSNLLGNFLCFVDVGDDDINNQKNFDSHDNIDQWWYKNIYTPCNGV